MKSPRSERWRGAGWGAVVVLWLLSFIVAAGAAFLQLPRDARIPTAGFLLLLVLAVWWDLRVKRPS